MGAPAPGVPSVTGAGLRPSLIRLLDRLCCPACRARGAGEFSLVERREGLACASCAAWYPVVGGIPDLREDAAARPLAAVDGRALAFYERAGFSIEGRARGDTVHDGIRLDSILLSLLAEEYKAPDRSKDRSGR